MPNLLDPFKKEIDNYVKTHDYKNDPKALKEAFNEYTGMAMGLTSAPTSVARSAKILPDIAQTFIQKLNMKRRLNLPISMDEMERLGRLYQIEVPVKGAIEKTMPKFHEMLDELMAFIPRNTDKIKKLL